ncbi:MAG: hypothetical protein JSS27_15830 [Planctomycetes bacterium]|nr:hypothetical protein [Planctomycetota bacterium]
MTVDTKALDTKALTPERRWLLERMHQTNHGTMHNLIVRGGEPVLDPPPKIRQAFKLSGQRSKPRTISREFVLKDQHVELFELMESKQNGVISKLVIQDGLPFLAEWDVD